MIRLDNHAFGVLLFYRNLRNARCGEAIECALGDVRLNIDGPQTKNDDLANHIASTSLGSVGVVPRGVGSDLELTFVGDATPRAPEDPKRAAILPMLEHGFVPTAHPLVASLSFARV